MDVRGRPEQNRHVNRARLHRIAAALLLAGCMATPDGERFVVLQSQGYG
jgi:hypothetical protein